MTDEEVRRAEDERFRGRGGRQDIDAGHNQAWQEGRGAGRDPYAEERDESADAPDAERPE